MRRERGARPISARTSGWSLFWPTPMRTPPSFLKRPVDSKLLYANWGGRWRMRTCAAGSGCRRPRRRKSPRLQDPTLKADSGIKLPEVVDVDLPVVGEIAVEVAENGAVKRDVRVDPSVIVDV